MHDLIIKGGTLVDGTGAPARTADVAIDGGRIVAIGRDVGSGDETIDARGRLVMPGFTQAHVHLCQTLFRGLADDHDVIGWLRRWIWPFERAHTAASMATSCRLGVAELLLTGTTTVLSMESVSHTDESFRAADEAGIRAVIGKALMDRREPGTEMLGESTDAAAADLADLVERWHGTADGRLQVAVSPRSPESTSPELWQICVALAEEADLRLHTPGNENRGQGAHVFDVDGHGSIAELDRQGALGDRLVMAHCVWLDPTERALVRARQPHVCHCPSANLKLASGFAPVPELLADGVNVALGADGAACNNRLDGFNEMRLAALLHNPRRGARAVSPARAFEMATVGGARALGLAEQIGTLEVGKLADQVVLRRDRPHALALAGGDPVSQVVYAHDSGDVDTVAVGGRVVVRDRRLLTLDMAELAAAAERERHALLARAEQAA
jgi:5-methylthioadenosine/S-adenosylhomocysteine deaminase